MTAILLGSILLFIEGCAPTLKTLPIRPSIVESNFDLALKDVDLVYESVPGEVLKYDFYFSVGDINIKGLVGVRPSEIEQIKKEIEKLKGSLSFSGELEAATEKVSLGKDISSKSQMKIKSRESGYKMIGETKSKESFRQVVSNKGKILYSDSDELWGMRSPQFFPDHSINIGDQWSALFEVDIKELGKVKFSIKSKLVGFKLIEGRPCAKIITEMKSAPIQKEDMRGIFNIVSTGYHDLKIGQLSYTNTIVSMNIDLPALLKGVDLPAELKGASVTLEFVYTTKLNYQNSIFKRPIN